MNSTQKVFLLYDAEQGRWYLRTRKKSRVKAIQRLYWGAKRSPLAVRFSTASPSQPSIPLVALVKKKNRHLLLGPLIGILTASSNSKPFQGNIRNFKDMMQTGLKKGAVVFVFTPDSIDWYTETIEGWIYDFQARKWRKGTFPFPNVVYNRVPNRQLEAQDEIRLCIEQLSVTKGVQLFNPHFFNKEDLFSLLQQSSAIKSHLPETKTFGDKTILKEMLLTHREVYLKPTKGRAGVGILKVSYQPQPQCFYLYSVKKGTTPTVTRRFETAWRWIRRHQINSPYLIQQGIALQQINNRPFDFRVLVQKNREGVWEVTGIGTRVAGSNRITTHVPQGGRIEDPNVVLSALYPATEAQQVKEHIKDLALTTAKELEKYYSQLAEMSMDIGLDQRGKMWFFEANSKPMKFDEPQIRNRSLSNLVEYSQYITFQQLKE